MTFDVHILLGVLEYGEALPSLHFYFVMASLERDFSMQIKQKMQKHYNADTDCILCHSQDTDKMNCLLSRSSSQMIKSFFEVDNSITYL